MARNARELDPSSAEKSRLAVFRHHDRRDCRARRCRGRGAVGEQSNPFKTRDTTSVTPPASKSAKPAPVAPNAAPPAIDSEKPRFDFYKILPGNETPMTDQDLHQRPTPAAGEQYFLQAGAFPNSADADNLKARLALLGFEAAIQTAELPGKGLWHRVDSAPTPAWTSSTKSASALVQNEIKAQLVKVKNPTPDIRSQTTPVNNPTEEAACP